MGLAEYLASLTSSTQSSVEQCDSLGGELDIMVQYGVELAAQKGLLSDGCRYIQATGHLPMAGYKSSVRVRVYTSSTVC